MQHRKFLSPIALQKLNEIWIRKDKIKLSLKLEIYKILVKPVLMYNCGTWGINKNEEKNMNSFHRQQLRRTKRKISCKMSNKNVYKITKEKPLSLEILAARRC